MSKRITNCRLALPAVLFLWSSFAWAEVKPHALFSDNMVVQQGVPINVWGTAKAGEKVTVKLSTQEASVVADGEGRWSVRLEAMKAGDALTMTISGDNTISFKNMAVGEVWVASGQSNMQWPVRASTNAEKEIAEANYPNIRLFTVSRVVAGKPQTDVQGSWSVCSPQTVGDFSAVAYFFGRELHKAIKVPVGLINTSWGGTPAEAWTSMAVLEGEPAFKSILDSWDARFKEYPAAIEAHIAAYGKAVREWLKSADSAEAAGKPIAPPPKLDFPGDPRTSPHRPAGLYNAMIHPLLPFGIKGAIWYQGESNAGRATQYRTLFSTMIRNWRKDWGLGDFPFLFVQLAPYQREPANPPPGTWPELREAQLLTMLNVPNTAMAVITDVGEEKDIHPKLKQPVGARLALAARALGYGERIEYSGPIYKDMKRDGSKIVISFTHTGGGLVAKGGPLKGFTIASSDQKFVDAQAEIVGNTVVVSSPEVAEPAAVRYGWANFPVVNLWNKADLPASPFRTDDWPMVTAGK
ncbi:MAG TPA: sialate O-acetylesterase [Phycisphaerae bacterium]|nr:sialate O-acetylesterase [Phycisphaerae bacterium]HRR84932.1 sialate O-acetylesterase [Phycisphaerae bacterium]